MNEQGQAAKQLGKVSAVEENCGINKQIKKTLNVVSFKFLQHLFFVILCYTFYLKVIFLASDLCYKE